MNCSKNHLQVLLDTLSRVGGTSRYCLVHLLLHRDIGCVEGLGNLNGLCNRNSNFAWSKVHPENEDETVNTIAHEVRGHLIVRTKFSTELTCRLDTTLGRSMTAGTAPPTPAATPMRRRGSWGESSQRSSPPAASPPCTPDCSRC